MSAYIYLDNAATTPIDEEVIDTMHQAMKDFYGNPSSQHASGRAAKVQMENARRVIAGKIGAKPSEILFVSCGTEANNLVMRSVCQTAEIRRFITTPVEHPSVGNVMKDISKNYPVAYVKVNAHAQIDISSLEELLQSSSEKTLVSIMHANNEIGALNDIKKIGELCKQYGALFHSDCVQTMGHFPIDTQDIPVDFITASAHKFHGPKGVGFLFVRNPKTLCPQIMGGSQERSYRSGTENLTSIIGMAKALEIAVSDMKDHETKIRGMRDRFLEKLTQAIPDIEILTPQAPNLYTVASVLFPERMSVETLGFQLDMKGVCCSGGSACSSGAGKPSHVLEAIGANQKKKGLRFSFSRYNTTEEVDKTIEIIKELSLELMKNLENATI
ncbi:MAG: cysteine desulfurase [Chitinophagales bacterium]|jgi:cysteine desulfurase|nr:cysteine desulfurase [Chitinophagales bacterium]